MTDISGQLRLRLEQLVDEFVTSGAKAPDVIAALEKELAEMKAAHDRDPGPADDPSAVEEPANDWPGA
ncbi:MULTISPECIES: hypothetical protein [Agrobacterium]|uniref:hypothetical protein n=1 Tax=Agrobacterium TaxID=357 RepID=UPI002787F063|nr:hypothetical protein [Agrobacterium sp. SORGH_AS_0745]MDP9762094.1 hypothetical protein [Agrobacterium tumefaciens]MDQ1220617.1 hypothetical protein [Agrobacterium sp. SORGH_AS_0745]